MIQISNCILVLCTFNYFSITSDYPDKKDSKKEQLPQSVPDLRQQLTDILQKTHTPALSIALVRANQIEWVEGLGYADVESKRRATAETLFRAGSISKSFVALAILKLVHEGRLKLDDPIRKIIPEIWFENYWEESNPVRVVDLLEHTTGWDDLKRAEWVSLWQQSTPYEKLSEALNRYHFRKCAWPPGTRVAYNNVGPSVAAYIVEKITGQRFEDYVKQNVFQPLGIKTGTFFSPIAPIQGTTLYQSDGHTVIQYADPFYRPAGSLNVCAEDMARYLQFYLQRGRINSVEFIPEPLVDRMEKPMSSWAAKNGLNFGYALGNYSFIYDGFVYHGHAGAVSGALSEFAYMPEQKVGYFFSINSNNMAAFSLIGKIVREYLTRDIPKPAEPKLGNLPVQATEYVGWYEPNSPRYQWSQFRERLQRLSYISVSPDGKKMILRPLWRSSSNLYSVSGNMLRFKDEPQATVNLMSVGNGEKYIQVTGWTTETYKRIPTWLAYAQFLILLVVTMSTLSVLVYAPIGLLSEIGKKYRRPSERAMRFWPLLAILSLIGANYIFSLGLNHPNPVVLAVPSFWSVAVMILTITFAICSIGSVIAVWRVRGNEVRKWFRIYSAVVSVSLIIVSTYLAYWGIIGFSSWTQL